MHIIKTKRLDHLGLVMGTLREFKIIELIDQLLGVDQAYNISTGEAVAAMIINGLGFVSRPLSLTPLFFQSKALDVLFGRQIDPEQLNRHRLGRALDQIHQYGCEYLFSQIAVYLCQQIKLDQSFISLDTTTFTLTGNYLADSDEHEIKLTYGYSKDHRPDLKQAMLELVTSQDGGIPLMIRCLDGNASDSKVFQARCKQLIDAFKQSEGPRYLVGDSKLYHQDNKENLAAIKFITRIPKTYQEEAKAVSASLESNQWAKLDEQNQYYEYQLTHLDMKQRWLVVYSTPARTRAESSVHRQIEKEYRAVERALLHLTNQDFSCELDARESFNQLSAKLTYHELSLNGVDCLDRYPGVGRPKKGTLPMKRVYRIKASISCLMLARQTSIFTQSTYVIGTNTTAEELSAQEVIEAYKNQNASIERGFRFLKDPQFFVSSFYLKKPSRIMSLLMIMSLSLLVYSVLQRHLRQVLAQKGEKLPNQINQEVTNPTIRWVFQLLEGIDVVYMQIKDKIQHQIMGMTQLREKIIRLFYPPICDFYFPS